MANKMVKVSLEEKIDTLNKIAVEVFPANKVFKLAIAILALVKVHFFLRHAHSWASLTTQLGKDA